MAKYTAWTNTGGQTYQAAVDTVQELPSGIYEVVVTQQGCYFVRDDETDREILRFPDAPIDFVVSELESFWTKQKRFEDHGFPHKRGILLHGPPGSGKSCTVQLIARDVVKRGGLVFQFSNGFPTGYRILRDVEPERPIVVLMEDIDSIITPGNESTILNILDGIGSMRRVVFVATTNYIDQLPPRIMNRPSRFDRRVLIGHPSSAARRMYLESLIQEGDKVDLEKWVKATEGFSLAHLKELFVAVCILENKYEDSMSELRKMMKDKPTRLEGEDMTGVSIGVYA